MTLNDQHKRGLIHDILKTHHLDGVASQSEYEQLYRATKKWLDGQATDDYTGTLQAVHDYSAQAINMDGYDEHLSNNKSNLESWVQTLS
jgi:hypothetical protein